MGQIRVVLIFNEDNERQKTCRHRSQNHQRRLMILCLFPLVNKHNYNQRRHNEFNSRCVKMDHVSQESSCCCSCYPVKLIQGIDPEHEPAPVHAFRRIYCTVDCKRFVAHSKKEKTRADRKGIRKSCLKCLFLHTSH